MERRRNFEYDNPVRFDLIEDYKEIGIIEGRRKKWRDSKREFRANKKKS